ncbi:MAG: helix-turn-helix transcriptional regulator [Acidobacteria bacterium]|nr:helix-turn-helix transcriptional regulator [Acidobacteriota bacterium]
MQTPYLFPLGARLGEDNVVLRARSRRHRVDNYAGPLSIKTVLKGEVAWIVGGRRLVVDPSSFLIIAAGELYSMNIDSEQPVETCCAFFAAGFVESIARDMTSPVQSALDEPYRMPAGLPYLSAMHSVQDRSLAGHVRDLAPRCKGELAPSGFEEDFLVLGENLLQFYERVRREAAQLPVAKESTRQELYRRLLTGRDYLHAHSSGGVSLLSVAREACLSPYHFHRGFAHAFGRTPHAYLTAVRLEGARRQLESGASVLEACLAAGFSSTSAFTRLFRSHFGEPPSAVRRKFARSGKNAEAESCTLTS